MSYDIQHIAEIIRASVTGNPNGNIEHLLTDSRKVYAPATSLFFALQGPRRDGHHFIPELYDKGVRFFVVTQIPDKKFPDALFLQVEDSLEALQLLAAYHRSQFSIPVIGITGSNGKTIVKEWLYQLLQTDFNIVRSPKSFNSQLGVPLSVWQMDHMHTLAIFEAGISQPGEMEKLQTIIKPTIGILTSIGDAHSSGFKSKEQKEKEKRILFRNARLPEKLQVTDLEKTGGRTTITARTPVTSATQHIVIPFTDEASILNAVTCWEVMRMLGYNHEVIQSRMMELAPVNMRLELRKGIQGCYIINDSYSADTSSLTIALNFLEQQSGTPGRTVILSDFMQSSIPPVELYNGVLANLSKHGVNRLIGIGEQLTAHLAQHGVPGMQIETFFSTEDFLRHFRFSSFRDETILVKGARVFAFESIVKMLEQKVHQTVLEINLGSIIHNLKQYQSHLRPTTKVMAMVKAFAYGSGGAEIAGVLQYHKVDYLGVAYTDEGVDLRKAGISLPIMVMNPEPGAFPAITEYNLEPELYSFAMMEAFDGFLKSEGLQQYPVHIEVETGMNRLGFHPDDIPELGKRIQETASFRIQSVFTHLAASEEAVQDEFTVQQFNVFEKSVAVLKSSLQYEFITHIANSAAAVRHPSLQLDMVRLGIGLYGIDSAASGKIDLQTVAVLKSTVAQVKHLKKGESVSYNRRSIMQQDAIIATVRIGYADGYPRNLGNGAGKVRIRGQLAEVVGAVCMDMFMIDITEIPGVQAGDEVIIFGETPTVQQLADNAGTIPYEIMTGISQRVQRVYFQE